MIIFKNKKWSPEPTPPCQKKRCVNVRPNE